VAAGCTLLPPTAVPLPRDFLRRHRRFPAARGVRACTPAGTLGLQRGLVCAAAPPSLPTLHTPHVPARPPARPRGCVRACARGVPVRQQRPGVGRACRHAAVHPPRRRRADNVRCVLAGGKGGGLPVQYVIDGLWIVRCCQPGVSHAVAAAPSPAGSAHAGLRRQHRGAGLSLAAVMHADAALHWLRRDAGASVPRAHVRCVSLSLQCWWTRCRGGRWWATSRAV
jgi:hypothetical protein